MCHISVKSEQIESREGQDTADLGFLMRRQIFLSDAATLPQIGTFAYCPYLVDVFVFPLYIFPIRPFVHGRAINPMQLTCGLSG